MGRWLLWNGDRLHSGMDAAGSLLNDATALLGVRKRSIEACEHGGSNTVEMELTDYIRMELAHNELLLWKRFGIRVRVDSISRDGSKFICTASRLRRSILHANMPEHEVVEHASSALACLRKQGIMALIGVMDRSHDPQFKALNDKTPFGILAKGTSTSFRGSVEGAGQRIKEPTPLMIIAA